MAESEKAVKPEWPEEWMAGFLAALRNSANVRASADLVKIGRRYVFKAKKKYPRFAVAWDEAVEDAVDTLEAVAWQRARTQSDYLLWRLLAANRREKYGDAIKVNLDLEHEARKIAEREGLPPEQAGRLLSISEKLKQRSTG
jgi:hypothetical protein